MIYDKTSVFPCIIQPPPPPDTRCLDARFALQNPGTCPSALILKPATAIICELDSIDFNLFEFKGGLETELTTGVVFTSSDPDIFVIGVNSGSGTALVPGTVIITATYGDRTVSATVTIQESSGMSDELIPRPSCCNDIQVATAIVVDNSYSMSLANFPGYGSRLSFAKAVASAYGGKIAEVDGSPKDSVGVLQVASTLTELLPQSQDTDDILSAIAGIIQTQEKTDLLRVFTETAVHLLSLGVDRPVILLISDCEQTEPLSASAASAPPPSVPAVPPAACKNTSGYGSPMGVKTPDCENQFYRDKTNNNLWVSTGLTNTSWLALIVS